MPYLRVSPVLTTWKLPPKHATTASSFPAHPMAAPSPSWADPSEPHAYGPAAAAAAAAGWTAAGWTAAGWTAAVSSTTIAPMVTEATPFISDHGRRDQVYRGRGLVMRSPPRG